MQRFGDYKAGEAQVIIENHRWVALGKPETVEITFEEPKNKRKKSHPGKKQSFFYKKP